MLWTHAFNTAVARPIRGLGAAAIDDNVGHLAHVDLDGDGELDDLLALARGVTPAEPSLLAAISDSGRVLWQIDGRQAMQCGSQRYEGPSWITAVALRDGGRLPEVWVAFTDQASWPSSVMQILPDGRQVLRYVQSGWVMSLAEWRTPKRTYMAAGGVFTEFSRASIALFDPAAPLTAFRGTNASYTCDAPGAVQPARVILLPNFEVPKALGNQTLMVTNLRPLGSQLKAELTATSDLIVQVGTDGTVQEISASDQYWFQHQRLELGLALLHPSATCPDRVAPKEVRHWTSAGGWTTGSIRLTGR